MNYVIYTKNECNYCTMAKSLLNERRVPYTEVVIGEDITREVFKTAYPSVKTVPFIKYGSTIVGGYKELKESFDNANIER